MKCSAALGQSVRPSVCFRQNSKSLHISQQQPRRQQRSSRSLEFRCNAFFNFGKSDQNVKKYASDNGRDDYKEEDVEDYFNYMGILAAEGNYDRLEKMLGTSENDAPKVAEVLRAGASLDVKDVNGKTAKELTDSEAVLELLSDREKAFTF